MSESRASNVATVTVGDHAYWQKAVERMTELTKAGTLKWDVVDTAQAKVSSPLAVLAAYDARYDNRTVRFLETEPTPTTFGTLTSAIDNSPALKAALLIPSGKHRRPEYSLLLVDVNGIPLFAFPKMEELVELLAAIRSQIADVESFVDALFAAA